MRWIPIGAAALLFVCAGAARADVVVLRGGGSLEGIVTQRGDEVTVEMPYGKVSVHRNEVVQVVKKRTPLEEYRQREAQVKSGDAEGLYQLGAWAEQNDLPGQARHAFEHAIAADPNHAAARARLGFEKNAEGKWLTFEEAQRARGLVRVNGDWVTAEEAKLRAALVEQKALEAKMRVEEARAEAARQEAAKAERQAAARLAALEQQYAQIAADREREYDRWRRRAYYDPWGGYGYYGYPIVYTYSNRCSGNGVTGNYTQDGTGAFVTVTTNSAGQQVWVQHPGGGAPDSIIHASGDGHCVMQTSQNGQTVLQHFGNGTCGGTPDATIRQTNAQHP